MSDRIEFSEYYSCSPTQVLSPIKLWVRVRYLESILSDALNRDFLSKSKTLSYSWAPGLDEVYWGKQRVQGLGRGTNLDHVSKNGTKFL